VYSYESVATNLTLPEGTYFALFAIQGNDTGSILMTAKAGGYQAGSTTMGILNPLTGISYTEQDRGAVRILGSLPGVTTSVSIDIKPGNFPNSININPQLKENIPVAILSTIDFDAQQVDRDSLTFGRTGNEDSLQRRGRNSTPNCGVNDVNSDGLPDLVCHFYANLTGFRTGDIKGILRGRTMGDEQIEGRDSVRIVRS
jgi:hypothetical protein